VFVDSHIQKLLAEYEEQIGYIQNYLEENQKEQSIAVQKRENNKEELLHEIESVLMKVKEQLKLYEDDAAEQMLHELIEQILKEKYDVTPLNSGVRALQYLKKNKPDLILLDVRMASMDGIETLREIREMEKCAGLPVIMLTSQREKQNILESSKLGINDYVLKPFKTQDLHDRIERVLKSEMEKRLENR